jgi:hypothetical protein
MAESSNQPSSFPWRAIFRKALRRFSFLAVPVIFWLLLGKVGLVGQNTFSTVAMILAVLLFLAGMPLSIVLHLDNLSVAYNIQNNYLALVLGLVIVFFNLLGWGILKAGWRRIFPNEQPAKDADELGSQGGTAAGKKLNGTEYH